MTRSWWGWGWADRAIEGPALDELARLVAEYLPLDGDVAPIPPVPELPRPRTAPGPRCAADPLERAEHAHGKAYRDVVRNLRGEVRNPPDHVAWPRTEADVVAVLDWAAEADVAVVPYGGGTSVVGGIEYRGDRPWVSLDLGHLSGVAELDQTSRAARIRAGTLGPSIEDALRPAGLTLRHYPQSFEFSTLGGWLATRAGGHFATGYTHIDDAVESLRVVTPAGTLESLRVPGSGAGPSPDRLWLGSEGALGVIVEAWVRLLPRPRFRARAAVSFEDYEAAVDATRAIAQSGLHPSNCRLLDPLEAALATGAGEARLLLGFESADHPVDAGLARAMELCGGATVDASTVDEWRAGFLAAPYRRDALVRLGVVVETCETACTWTRFHDLHAAVAEAVAQRGAFVTCRFTHVYPDGPAPYFTVYAPGRRGAEVSIWDELKAAVTDAITASGGTVTHHHAVGRDHRPWYDRQRPDLFASSLGAAKRLLDPRGILNPGVLID